MISKGYVLYVLDSETTGFDPKENEVIELSVIRLILGETGIESEEQKTWFMKATKPATISDEALKINGHKKEDILWMTADGKEKYQDPAKALVEIENWIAEDDVTVNDRVIVGHNVIFDFDMIEGMWNRHYMADTFPFITGHNKLLIDTKALALFIDILMGKRRKYYNLGKIIKAYGIKAEKAHRADADTRMTKDLFIKQSKPFIDNVKNYFKNIYDSED